MMNVKPDESTAAENYEIRIYLTHIRIQTHTHTHTHTHSYTCIFIQHRWWTWSLTSQQQQRKRRALWKSYIPHAYTYIHTQWHTHTHTLIHMYFDTTQMMDVKPDQPTAAEKETCIMKIIHTSCIYIYIYIYYIHTHAHAHSHIFVFIQRRWWTWSPTSQQQQRRRRALPNCATCNSVRVSRPVVCTAFASKRCLVRANSYGIRVMAYGTWLIRMGHDSQCARESQSSSSMYGFRIEALSLICADSYGIRVIAYAKKPTHMGHDSQSVRESQLSSSMYGLRMVACLWCVLSHMGYDSSYGS